MNWAIGAAATLVYWLLAVAISLLNTSVPCPAETDCESASLRLLWQNLAMSGGLYLVAMLLFVGFIQLRKRRS